MVRRILYAIFDVGIDRWEGTPDVDLAAHADIALETARQGIVLLKNDGVLPLAAPSPAARPQIAVIGGHAQLGVPIGTGSSAVIPPGGYAEIHTIGGPGIMGSMRNLYLLPSSPLAELQKLLPGAAIEFDPGMSPAEAALLARRSDVAIVFGIRVEGEGYDIADLSLPWGQDAVIDAVAAANPNTVVVLETGNPVAMPWLREGPGRPGGLVSRPVRRAGDRRDPHRRHQSVRATPADLPGRPGPDAAAGAAGPRHAVGHADDHPLRRGRRRRLPLVRQDRAAAAVPLRPRAQLHPVRLRGPDSVGPGRGAGRVHRHQ